MFHIILAAVLCSIIVPLMYKLRDDKRAREMSDEDYLYWTGKRKGE